MAFPPVEKVPLVQAVQVPLTSPKAAAQVMQLPFVELQVWQLALQGWQVPFPVGLKVSTGQA